MQVGYPLPRLQSNFLYLKRMCILIFRIVEGSMVETIEAGKQMGN